MCGSAAMKGCCEAVVSPCLQAPSRATWAPGMGLQTYGKTNTEHKVKRKLTLKLKLKLMRKLKLKLMLPVANAAS